MKKALKVTFGAVLAASMALPAFAGTNDFLGRTAVSVAATYTEASNNGVSMGDVFTVIPGAGVAFPEGARRAFFIEPEHEFNFNAGITHRLLNNDSRLFLTYDHFRDDKERDASGIRNLGLAPAAPVTSQGYGEVRHREHELRGGINHTLHFGRCFDFDIAAFFEYAKLERKMIEHTTLSNGNRHYRQTEDEMRGYGPGIGAMGHARPLREYPNVGFFAGATMSLLYSDHEYDQYMNSSSPGAPVPLLNYQFHPEDSKSIVTKVDAQFGIEYRRKVTTDITSMMVAFELGMRYMNMMNALRTGNTSYEPTVLNNAVASSFAQYTGAAFDYGRMGPFFRFTIGGANS